MKKVEWKFALRNEAGEWFLGYVWDAPDECNATWIPDIDRALLADEPGGEKGTRWPSGGEWVAVRVMSEVREVGRWLR